MGSINNNNKPTTILAQRILRKINKILISKNGMVAKLAFTCTLCHSSSEVIHIFLFIPQELNLYKLETNYNN